MSSKKKPTDFKKKKTKLGEKRKAATYTPLTFHTRTIAMPDQVADKGTFVTHRNLSLDDLLPQLSHYNENVRKDALGGIKDLITAYPPILVLHLGRIFEKIVELMVDVYKSVRHTLVTLFSTIVEQLPEDAITPFFPLLVVYCTSALTHVKQGIRLDGASIINLLVQKYPGLAADLHHRILKHYLSVLFLRQPLGASAAQDAAALKITGAKTKRLIKNENDRLRKTRKMGPALSPLQARLLIIESLHHLLVATFAKQDGAHPAQIKSTVVAADEAHQGSGENVALNHFELAHQSKPIQAKAESSTSTIALFVPYAFDKTPSLESFDESLTNKSSVMLSRTIALKANSLAASIKSNQPNPASSSAAAPSSGEDSSVVAPNAVKASEIAFDLNSAHDSPTGLRAFFAQFLPALINCWLESEPSPTLGANSQNMSLILTVISNLIQRIVETSKSSQEAAGYLRQLYAKDLHKHILNHFPFSAAVDSTEAHILEISTINVQICQIFSYLFESSLDTPKSFVAAATDADVMEVDVPTSIPPWAQEVMDYTRDSFEGKAGLAAATVQVTPTLPKERFTKAQFKQLAELLPVVKRLLFCSWFTTKHTTALLQVFNKVYQTCPSQSSAKRKFIAFIADLLKRQAQSNFDGIVSREVAYQWLSSLPKVLWQLQDTDTNASLTILAILREFAMHSAISPPDSPHRPQMASLLKALGPYFYGEIFETKSGQKQKRRVFGPFITVADEIQRAMMDVLFYCPALPAATQTALVHCLSSSTLFEGEIEYYVNLPTVQYILEALSISTHFGGSTAQYFSFLVSLLLASAGKQNHLNADSAPSAQPSASGTPDWRHSVHRLKGIVRLVARLCHSAFSAGDAKLLAALEPHLLQILSDKGSKLDVRYVTLRFLGKLCKYALPKVLALPASLLNVAHHVLSTSIYQYLRDVWAKSESIFDFGPSEDLLTIYSRPLLSDIIDHIRNKITSVKKFAGAAIDEFDKLLVLEIVSVRQQTFRSALQNCDLRQLHAKTLEVEGTSPFTSKLGAELAVAFQT